MDARTLAAFVLGVGLTAAAFLLLGGTESQGAGPTATIAGESDASTPDGDHAMLSGSGTATAHAALRDLAPTEKEVEWLDHRLREERIRREAARIRPEDDGIQVMQRVFEHGGDPAPLLRSYEAFRAPIVEAKETQLALTEPAATETISFKDGDRAPTVIELGPGVFTLAPQDAFWKPLTGEDETIERLVIRGAGMDRTTLKADNQWSLLAVMGTVKHLVIRDLTIEANGTMGGLDIRGKASMALENVRISGWQRAGHAAAIGVSGETYLGCKGCEFLGSGKNSGWAISLRGRALVLCEDCRFLHLDAGALIGSGDKTKGGHAVLRDCTFKGSRLADRAFAFPVEVEGGDVRFGGAEATDEERQRQWGVQHATRVSNTSFAAMPPVCTLGTLLDVLEKIRVPGEEQVVGIALDGVTDGRPKQFRVYTLPASGSRTKTWIADVSRGWPELERLERDGGRGLPPLELVRRARPFLTILKGSEVPEELEVTALSYRHTGGERPHATVSVGERNHHRMWYLNAETGEVIRRPK